MPMSLDPEPGENEVECARCGAHVYIALSRCPKCGVNLYEPEDEGEDQDLPYRQGATPVYLASESGGLFTRIGQLLRRLTGRPHPAEVLFGASLQQAELFDDLLRKVGGDRQAVERLVAYERSLAPTGNRTIWLQNALRRWEQDNR